MRIRFIHIPLLLLFIAALHFAALYSGLYDMQIAAGFVWWDNVLHALVGVAFGLGWLWLLERLGYGTRSLAAIISTFVFVLLMAIVWEGAEYLARLYVRSLAEGLKLYSPNLTESGSDVLSNMVGVIALLAIFKFKRPDLDKLEAGV
ncbi:hypothetical protein A2851_01895 [Candidatus Kaiserbacteria bacterium RIFCSPHIGHO2_01_FULL_53_29]|uniref:VanZ-like domain-containing protein n=1 Tax=Candidatus Kaiserbacteria bacterium RIFCSPHIGHO2_01_FULL_53_29 TaxID=1798480 RepID=A0A1F6CX26_9BACT|nr:MAG: hypothetical protein A2851_01895 [Candidatus Kaiserbacteria bacterium RIFCSPHIGHO2_01_FULL_53_29]